MNATIFASVVTLPRNALASALHRALAVAPKGELVTLDVRETTASLRATGAHASIAVDLDIGPADPFRVSVNGRALVDRVDVMPSGPVSFALDGAGAMLCAGRRSFRLAAPCGLDFTDDRPETWADVTGASTRLAGALRAVVHASPLRNETSLPPCVVLESVGGGLVVYAVDGSRVSIARVEGIAWSQTVLVHGLDIKSLSAELERATEASFALTPRELWLRTSDALASFALLDGKVPSSAAILGLVGPAKTKAVVNSLEFSESLHATSLAAGENKGVTLTLDPKGSITLASVDGPKANGVAVDEFACNVAGPRMVFQVNHRFLSDAIKALDAPQLEIAVGDMSASHPPPITLRSVGGEIRTELVMPQRSTL